VLGDRTDLAAFISYAVVDRAVRHDDGPFHWYCIEGPCEPHNFYLYEEPASRRIHVIPWDLDNSLQLSNGITDIADEWGATRNDCEPFPFGPINLMKRSAACDPLVAAWSSLPGRRWRLSSQQPTLHSAADRPPPTTCMASSPSGRRR
jgi:hypothetical protein